MFPHLHKPVAHVKERMYRRLEALFHGLFDHGTGKSVKFFKEDRVAAIGFDEGIHGTNPCGNLPRPIPVAVQSRILAEDAIDLITTRLPCGPEFLETESIGMLLL